MEEKRKKDKWKKGKKDKEMAFPVLYQFNLSDFALFQSVMKSKRAYECTISIILDEPGIRLREVKVEEKVLNESGKRSICLDAWARDTMKRQINMEMQNDSTSDNIPKRARFYQSLADSPVLKSGKETRYRQLPSTIIIFITQYDIFKKDYAKYTFLESCEELPELYLGDGTKKIFLNMTSKNGTPELISLLQYMKNSDLNNPEIIVKDKRIIELDGIVQEVKESKEWEDITMGFREFCMQQGMEQGMAQGMEQGMAQGMAQGTEQERTNGIRVLIDRFHEEGFANEKILEKLQKSYALTPDDAEKYLQQYLH